MKKIIDNITETTGWTGYNGASIHAVNSIINYIAGNNSASVIFKFDGTSSYIEKVYAENIESFKELVIWVTSTQKGVESYNKTTDFKYKIDLGAGKEFYLEARKDFYDVVIDVSDIDVIDRIRVTALEDGVDYLVLSYCLVSKDVFPLDIFQGIKEQGEYYIENFVDLKLLGTITSVTGDTSIDFVSPIAYLNRYGVIKIDDGVNSEIHAIAIESDCEGSFVLGQLYDGPSLLNDYTDAEVYLYYPVEFGTTQKEIILPSITVWGFAPEKQLLVNDLDTIIDSVKPSDESFGVRQVGQYLKWPLMITCVAKEEWELLGEISEIVRALVGIKIIWVNGRKCYIDFSAPATEQYPTESFDIMPQIQYPVEVSIREDLYNRSRLPSTTTINTTVNIVEQGEL